MTNSNLIPVFNGLIQNQPVQLCNARELHAFVESKQEYATWIKNRINEYGFIQDEDYLVITERTNGRPRKEYHITLDMGKELGMVERNERGRQIRKYFIECERRATQPKQPALPEPKPKTYTIEMTENDITVLLWLWFIAVRVIGSLKMLVKPLKLLQAPIAPEVVSQAHEYPFTVEHARRILLKMSKDLEAEPWRDDNLSRVLPKIRNFNESDLAYPGDHRNS